MDVSCNCFGLATAARVPVKRYNLLVPDVFPVVEPPFGRPLGIAIERKIKKLGEYLDKNEHRAPKVSRRLQRRLYRELQAGHWGYAQLVVATYEALLQASRPEKSNLLANELVVRTVVKRRTLPLGHKVLLSFKEPHLGSAVGLLLTHPAPQLRKLGVELLIDFTRCQQTSDYVPQLEAFVPLLCANAKPHASAGPVATPASPSWGATLPVAAKRGAPSAAAAAAEEAEHWAQLRAACLRALLEHLRFCARLSYVSYHLHTITFSVLECVEASGVGVPQGQYVSPRAALERGLNPLDSISRGSISHTVAASPPDVAALLVFEELAHMTRDAAEGKKVLEFVMRFLDHRGRWLGTPVARTCLAVLQAACGQEHQRYLLFSSLLRHVAAAEQLLPAERAAVLGAAVEEGRQLEPGLASPALLLALRELPAVIASHAGPGGEVPPMPTLAAPAPPAPPAPAAEAVAPGDAAVEAAAAPAAPAAAAAAGAVPGSAQELELPRLPPLASRPAQDAPVDLQPLVLAAVQQLAARVEDGQQLLEAVGSSVNRLRGEAPISTAALQCCVAAAQAMQLLAPRPSRAPGTAPRGSFSSLLLQELAGIAVHWGPQQRLLAHQLLLQLLPAASDGLKEQQAAVLLSALWHEGGMGGSPPAAYVAMDCTLRALLAAAPAAALPPAAQMLAALQLEVLRAGGGGSSGSGSDADGKVAPAEEDGRLEELSAAQACALLCVCQSGWRALAAQLGHPALCQLGAPGCDAVLAALAASPHGLLLPALGGSNGAEAGRAGAAAAQQQFAAAAALGVAFSAEEQQRAAAFLAQWRRGAPAAAQQAALAAALGAVPLFQQQAGASGGQGFQPMPRANLLPRMMRQGNLASLLSNGSHASAGEGDSKRAQRLRTVYRHMRQISLSDGDRAMLATISQESAAEEPPAGALQLHGLGLPGLEGSGEGGGGGGGKSVDEVLAEVDAALAAAQAALDRARGSGGTSPPPLGSALGSGGDAPTPVASLGGGGGAAAPVSAVPVAALP